MLPLCGTSDQCTVLCPCALTLSQKVRFLSAEGEGSCLRASQMIRGYQDSILVGFFPVSFDSVVRMMSGLEILQSRNEPTRSLSPLALFQLLVHFMNFGEWRATGANLLVVLNIWTWNLIWEKSLDISSEVIYCSPIVVSTRSLGDACEKAESDDHMFKFLSTRGLQFRTAACAKQDSYFDTFDGSLGFGKECQMIKHCATGHNANSMSVRQSDLIPYICEDPLIQRNLSASTGSIEWISSSGMRRSGAYWVTCFSSPNRFNRCVSTDLDSLARRSGSTEMWNLC